MKRLVWGIGLMAVVALVAMAFYRRSLPVQWASPTVMTVVEYIAEDAKTRLADEYTVDMPVSGTVERIALEIGQEVEKGQIIIRVDAFSLEQRIKETQSLVAQARAQVLGVDVSKPKQEDLESAAIRIKEMGDALEIARKVRAVTGLNAEEAQKTYERAKAMVKDGAVSQSYFDEAEVRHKGLLEDVKRAKLEEGAAEKALEQVELAHRRLTGSVDDNEYMRAGYKAQIEGLEAQLAILRSDLEKTEVRAPVSGPVLEKYVEDKRVLVAGTRLLKIGDLTSIEIVCDILSEEVGRVKVGNRVAISGKALLGKTVEGSVKRIHPAGFMKLSSLGVEQQRVRTLVDFDNSSVRLLPGTSVDVEIITAESKNTLAVPERATIRREGRWSVFKVQAGRAKLVPVQIGLRNDDWAEILEGLSAEDTIISEPKNELEDGMRVTSLD